MLKPNTVYKYRRKYDKAFCHDLISHMKSGFSFRSFPGALFKTHKVVVAFSTVETWVNKHPEFKEAYDVGKALALHHYEKLVHGLTTGVLAKELTEKQTQKMDRTMIMFVLRTRFYKVYGDQLKLQGVEGGHKITVDSGPGFFKGFSDNTLTRVLSVLKKDQEERRAKEEASESRPNR